MNILVCVKQVPDTSEIKIDPVTNTLIRAGVPSIVNPFDAYALEFAARIKDNDPETKITVLSMGPMQAKEAIKTCLSVGADKGYLLSDRLFGGADTFATSYTLAKGIEYLEKENGKFDLILCGKQAIDGDTAQVGPEIAEHLGYAQVTYAVEIEADDGKATVKRETDSGYAVVEAELPCVITVTKPDFDPRMPTVRAKMAALRAEIPVLTAEMIEADVKYLGLKGSPTKVKRSFTPSISHDSVKIEEATAEACAKKLIDLLEGDGAI